MTADTNKDRLIFNGVFKKGKQSRNTIAWSTNGDFLSVTVDWDQAGKPSMLNIVTYAHSFKFV